MTNDIICYGMPYGCWLINSLFFLGCFVLFMQEEVTSPSGQVEPPGMHMIYLPFSDDIRHVEEVRTGKSDEQFSSSRHLSMEVSAVPTSH